ncbi:unnamed protein product [Cladocopium goreaui]|uniref:Copia protein (Gag-int-pol protein) [Cleaved into: Copia VLP protein Copia protease ] n=1 Tax=Cladocopium goreaui TaxID=2562237 RepID=A0A9P1G1J4_9DINO|nr:unnamed protein product [Cladocopium goreaui]
MRVDDDQKFSTPEEPKKEAADPHSKEVAGSPSKEAVDPHSKEVAGSPSKEAVDPHSKEVAGSPSKEAADPHFKEAVRPPKTEAQDPRSFKAEEAVRPPKHEAEDSRSSQPKEAADPQSQRPKDDGSGANTTFTERSLEFMALMMDSMKEMHKRLNEPKDEGVIKGVETVRSGAPDLPLLAPWEPQQGPLILGDWLLIIEPIISDLSTSASVWWKTSVSAAEAWYKVHMALSPLDRIQHKVETPEEVLQQKWERLERRVATMLLQALPQEVRGELVAARRLTTFGVITHLLVTYSPGGISEKQNLLRNLEDPPEIQTIQDGPAALRRWLRWRHRAKDIGAVAPDPSLQLRGLLKMSKKTLEAHRELQFRVSLVRSGLQVDTVPNDTNVEQFAYHLLAEYEQLSISEKRPGGNATTSKQDATKAKQNEVEKPKAAKLRKLEEDARPKERGESSPQKPKVQKVEGEDTSSTSSKLKEDEGTEGPTMKELLEQEMMDRLQQQLDRMKLKGLKINQINYGSQQGLVDSGATHPLRPMRLGESKNDYKKVSVTLANGESTALQVTPGGVMVSERKDVEPIIPMGMLVQKLGCRVDWNQGTLQIHHPDRGLLPVQPQEGCPQIPRALALELIDELETKALQSKPEEKKFEKEKIWMQALVEAHPVLRQLPAEIKKSLVVDVGSWRDLPVNRRQRRRLQLDGFIAHLYAGESEGFTLTRAYQQQGGNPADILEVDIKRGENHNLLMDSGVYSGLLCAVMSDKVEAFIAGPNCRTRSVLRHYPKENAPRPVRAWGGEEFGLKDLSEQERLQVLEDDILMWRSSAQLSRWAPGTMNMVAESLMLQVKCQPLKMCPLSWDEHIAHGHTPYRRDCLVCQQTMQQQHPHRKVPYPVGGVLSLDVAGPLIPAKDLGGLRARWMLVGTLTWAVPAGSNKLQDAHVPQADGDEPHFEVHPEEEEGKEGAQALEDKREERSEAEEEEGGKVEVWGEEDGEKKEDELSQKPHPVPPYLLPPSQPKDGEKELQPGGFDTKIFRLASPMITKTAREVTRTTMDMLLRLRMDGFHIGRIHSDRGREFAGQFKKWANSRGIALSRTSGDDPRANGRVEVAIKTLKTQVRRLLKAADVGSELWPLAARYADALNRSWRIGEEPKFPPFLQEVLVRRRTWRKGVFEPTTETVQYLFPATEEHGHWILPKDEPPRVTRYVMKKAKDPVSEHQWLALEKDTVDALLVRRRLRGKSAIRKIEEDDVEEKEREDQKKRKMAAETNEEEEVLQTRIVSPREVAENWSDWLPAITNEVDSLLKEKEAFREIYPEELHKMQRRLKGPEGGKKKMRWVVCGNLEPKKEQEDNFSSGADASALRILCWCCALYPWVASTLDVRTAFLNAKMVLADDEDPILIKPPALLVEKKYLRRDVYYLPEKAIYGLRRSPRLWGLTRDETISDFSIQGEHNGKHMEFMLEPLQSEPNLWKLRNALEPEDTTLYGLLMTYVDDLMLASSPNLLQAMQAKIQSTWTTSTPEFVGPEPVRFLGMEISKEWKEEFQRDVWMVTQQSYTKDLTQKDPEVKPKRIPLTRDQSAMEPNEAEITPELIRSCQKAVGEVLWLTTRARPDIMYAVSRMGSSSTRAPHAVLAAALQLKGYLMATSDEGLMFNVKEGESPVLTVYTDAGFAPDAQESHGSFVVLLGTTPIFWRSGRQSYITLSTAEAELTEIVEGMIAGESIYVILAELFPVVHKLLKTDSQSALAILSNDGGNWRTRHLRLRCSFARQSILAGEWVIQHVAGEFMIADIGTKPLTAARLEFLKKLMGMGKLVIKDEVKSMEVEEKKEGEKQDGLLTTKEKTKVAEAAQVLRLITLAASIAAVKAEEGEKEHEETYPFEVIIAYTLGIIILTLVAQRIWNAAVRGVIVVRQYVLANLGRLSMNAVRKEEEIPEGDQSESLPASNESRSTDSNDGDQVPPQAPLPIPEDPPSTSEAPRPEQAINVVLQSEATQTGILPGYIANVAQTGIFPGPESEVIQTGIIPGSDSRMTQTGTFPGFNDRDAQTGTIPGHETSALFQSQEERAAALEMLRQHDATMVNYEAEWNQILREEDRVRDELTNAQPGHPILGPMNPPQAEPALPLLPFEVITTRHGTVYHNRLDCRYLTAPMTGHARLHRWCTKCRAEAAQTGRIPGHGFAVLISGREIDFHTDVTCEEAERASTFALCTACLEGT